MSFLTVSRSTISACDNERLCAKGPETSVVGSRNEQCLRVKDRGRCIDALWRLDSRISDYQARQRCEKSLNPSISLLECDAALNIV